MIIIFYKAMYNVEFAFNLTIIEFFNTFYTRILTFLFAIVHYGISEYQSGAKGVKLVDREIAQNICYNT